MMWTTSLLALTWVGGYARFLHAWGRALDHPSTALREGELTVVIPARNEAERLGSLLEDLKKNGVNVIVVDDHSEDATATVARNHGAETILSRGIGKKTALREGFLRAKTEWVATLDADVRVGPHWSKAMLGPATNDVDAVIGPVRLIAPHPNLLERIQSIEYGCMLGWAFETAWRGEAFNGSGANALWRREVWLTLDLLNNEASGDDVFALSAIRQQGRKVAAAWGNKAWAETLPCSDVTSWAKQRARWGKKARHYRSRNAVIVSASIALFLPLLIVLACCNPLAALLLWCGKALLDCRYAAQVARTMQLPWNGWTDAAMFALIYPMMLLLAGGFMLQNLEWKGRRI